MFPSQQRQTPHRHASFHDASAREAYAARFRPIAIPAVAAGTRSSAQALVKQHRDVPAILRHGSED
jgi:hypothetical protein